MPVPTLTTPRLRLTPLDAVDDLEAYFHLVADPEVALYIGIEPLTALAEADKLLAGFARAVANGSEFHWGVRPLDPADNTLLGSVNLQWNRPRRRAETGYYFARRYWGQGYGKEALAAVLDFGFGALGLNRIEAMVYPENVASSALLRSLGFQQEAYLREHAWEKGRYWDDLIFGLLRREWEAGGGAGSGAAGPA